MKKNKLLIVRNEPKATQLRKVMPEDWVIND